ncbi:hypothetical protein BT69DRAFT_1297006 [Atractiella rhizophila]|nr:hypothetical protein BT69DRAFT_1297006 [Atractiella rhizophila]
MVMLPPQPLFLCLSLSFVRAQKEAQNKSGADTGTIVTFCISAPIVCSFLVIWFRHERRHCWKASFGNWRPIITCIITPFLPVIFGVIIAERILLVLQIILCNPEDRRFSFNLSSGNGNGSSNNGERFHHIEHVMKKPLRDPLFYLNKGKTKLNYSQPVIEADAPSPRRSLLHFASGKFRKWDQELDSEMVCCSEFTSNKVRIPLHRENTEKDEEYTLTMKQADNSRLLAVEAAVIRVMKRSRQLILQNLVTAGFILQLTRANCPLTQDTISSLQGQFKPVVDDINTAIKMLVEKEILSKMNSEPERFAVLNLFLICINGVSFGRVGDVLGI